MEESPEFQKALQEACEKEYRGVIFGGDYIKPESVKAEQKRLMEKHEEYLRQAELAKQQARIMTSPHMREITENLRRRNDSQGLICPICGERDHGNRINGKPYCLMYSKHRAKGVDGPVPLMTPKKAKDWKPPRKRKVPRSFTFNEPDGVTRKR